MGRRRARLTSPRCEVCGAKGAWKLSLESWDCCAVHVNAPKPDKPVYHFRTGERLEPDAPDPKPYRAQILQFDEMLFPIDHLDFEVDLEADLDGEPDSDGEHDVSGP